MSHERSETIERDGRFYNVYGRGTARAGHPLRPLYDFERPFYQTLGEALISALAGAPRGLRRAERRDRL